MLKSDIFIKNVIASAEREPSKIFATLLFPGQESVVITYDQLIKNAGRYARLYRDRGVQKDQVVIIILKHSAELLYSFVGAMLHGAVPSIFSFPSTKISKEVYEKTLSLLLQVCDTRFLLTDEALANESRSIEGVRGKMTVIQAKDYLRYAGDFYFPTEGDPASVVLLQHSSGTTGLKKGVALSNLSVMNQIRHYAAALSLTKEDKIASWLPLYHDMGLIACFILPMVCGVPVVMMSPFDWVANPFMLLEAIRRERCTLCWLPNFAYNFMASNIPDDKKKDVDLSSIRAFINCAEPIRYESHEIFYEKFKNQGLRREAFGTCYAMAENTFAMTQGGVQRALKVMEIDFGVFTSEHKAVSASASTRLRKKLVSSGEVIANNEIRVVDNDRKILPEKQVGEIAIRSDSLMTEYYHRPDLTQAALLDGWYYTGDLGFLAEGHLFVTGRKKDMIIVAGKNIYPQDIEDIISTIPGIRAGRVVGFGVSNEELGTEEVVVLAETDREDPSEQLRLKLAIAKAIRDELECVVGEIVLLPHMWLLKSSSGKISRSGNREKYLKELRRG